MKCAGCGFPIDSGPYQPDTLARWADDGRPLFWCNYRCFMIEREKRAAAEASRAKSAQGELF